MGGPLPRSKRAESRRHGQIIRVHNVELLAHKRMDDVIELVLTGPQISLMQTAAPPEGSESPDRPCRISRTADRPRRNAS